MMALFESGRIVDLILLIMIIEAAVFGALALIWPGRVPVAGLLLNLGAGASLLLALRTVMSGAGWMLTAGFLALALVMHLGDLAQRLRR